MRSGTQLTIGLELTSAMSRKPPHVRDARTVQDAEASRIPGLRPQIAQNRLTLAEEGDLPEHRHARPGRSGPEPVLSRLRLLKPSEGHEGRHVPMGCRLAQAQHVSHARDTQGLPAPEAAGDRQADRKRPGVARLVKEVVGWVLTIAMCRQTALWITRTDIRLWAPSCLHKSPPTLAWPASHPTISPTEASGRTR